MGNLWERFTGWRRYRRILDGLVRQQEQGGYRISPGAWKNLRAQARDRSGQKQG